MRNIVFSYASRSIPFPRSAYPAVCGIQRDAEADSLEHINERQALGTTKNVQKKKVTKDISKKQVHHFISNNNNLIWNN